MAKKAKQPRARKDATKTKGRKSQKAAPAQSVSGEPTTAPAPGLPGRPTKYTPAIAEEILDRLSLGETLRQICDDNESMPSRITVMRWADEDREGFSDRYRASRDRQRDSWADDIVDISDDGSNDFMERKTKEGDTTFVYNREHVDRSKLRVATRQWLMKVGSPNKYGDKIEQTHKGDAAFVALWQKMGGGKSKQTA